MGGLNEIEKKNIILDKINTVYFEFSSIIENKNDLINIIEQSFKEEEKKYLSDKSILKYYNNRINLIWDKIENDRYIYLRLLPMHRKEVATPLTYKDIKKEKENQTNLENLIKKLNDTIKEIEKKAEEERKKFIAYKEEIEQKLKKCENEKNEKIRNDLQNKLQRKKEVNKLFEEELEKIKTKKYSEIEQKFIKSEKNFCMEEISKFDKQKIAIFLKKFLKNLKKFRNLL